jgi:hypothetical protein
MSALTYSASYPYHSNYDDRYYQTQQEADRAEQAARDAEDAAKEAQESAGDAKASAEYNRGFSEGATSARMNQ